VPDPATCCREQLFGFQQDGQHDLLAVYREQLFGLLEAGRPDPDPNNLAKSDPDHKPDPDQSPNN